MKLATPFTAQSFITANPATAQYQLRATGHVFATTLNNSVNDQGSWVTPNGNSPNYECFATLNAGTLTSGTTGSWLALTSDRVWTVNKPGTGAGFVEATITVQIRRVGTTQVLATAVVTIHAETN